MLTEFIEDEGEWVCDCGHINRDGDDECAGCGEYWE